MAGVTNPWLVSDPAPDKGKYFLMKSKYGAGRCGKNAARRYFQFPVETAFALGLFECFFSSCPLPSLLFPWGLGCSSALIPNGSKPRERLSEAVEHGRQEEVCVPWLILLLIRNSDTAWVTIKIPTRGNTFPQNQPCSAIALKHLLKWGKMGISCWISLIFVLPSGWHFPPSFPFASPVQKELIYEGDKGEQILEEPLWPQCHVFDKCPTFKKNEVKSWAGVNCFWTNNWTLNPRCLWGCCWGSAAFSKLKKRFIALFPQVGSQHFALEKGQLHLSTVKKPQILART